MEQKNEYEKVIFATSDPDSLEITESCLKQENISNIEILEADDAIKDKLASIIQEAKGDILLLIEYYNLKNPTASEIANHAKATADKLNKEVVKVLYSGIPWSYIPKEDLQNFDAYLGKPLGIKKIIELINKKLSDFLENHIDCKIVRSDQDQRAIFLQEAKMRNK